MTRRAQAGICRREALTLPQAGEGKVFLPLSLSGEGRGEGALAVLAGEADTVSGQEWSVTRPPARRMGRDVVGGQNRVDARHPPGRGHRGWVDGHDLGVGKGTAQALAHQGAGQVHVGGE